MKKLFITALILLAVMQISGQVTFRKLKPSDKTQSQRIVPNTDTLFRLIEIDSLDHSPKQWISLKNDSLQTMEYYNNSAGKREYVYSFLDTAFVELNIPAEKAFGKTFLLMRKYYEGQIARLQAEVKEFTTLYLRLHKSIQELLGD